MSSRRTRRLCGRPATARRRTLRGIERLEGRSLLSAGGLFYTALRPAELSHTAAAPVDFGPVFFAKVGELVRSGETSGTRLLARAEAVEQLPARSLPVVIQAHSGDGQASPNVAKEVVAGDKGADFAVSKPLSLVFDPVNTNGNTLSFRFTETPFTASYSSLDADTIRTTSSFAFSRPEVIEEGSLRQLFAPPRIVIAPESPRGELHHPSVWDLGAAAEAVTGLATANGGGLDDPHTLDAVNVSDDELASQLAQTRASEAAAVSQGGTPGSLETDSTGTLLADPSVSIGSGLPDLYDQESDGLIELGSVTAGFRKRATKSRQAETDRQSLRDVRALQLTRPRSPHETKPGASAPSAADDAGELIELAAANTSRLVPLHSASQQTAADSGSPVWGGETIDLETGVALYQAFELAYDSDDRPPEDKQYLGAAVPAEPAVSRDDAVRPALEQAAAAVSDDESHVSPLRAAVLTAAASVAGLLFQRNLNVTPAYELLVAARHVAAGRRKDG